MTEVTEFARRVERLCEYLLSRLYKENGRNGSEEQKFLEDLQNEALDIQADPSPVRNTLSGLMEFMGGFPPKTEES
jgi:hypothetical protein